MLCAASALLCCLSERSLSDICPSSSLLLLAASHGSLPPCLERRDLLLLPRNLEDKSLKILGRKPLALNHYYVWPQPNVQSEARVSTLDPSRSRRQRGTSALVSKWSSQEVNELWPGQERGGASSRWLQPISSGHWSRSSATPAPAQLGLCSINKTDTTLTQLRSGALVTLTRLTHFSSHRDTVGLDHQCLCMTSRTLFRRNSSHVFESWLPFQWEKNHHQCQKTLQSTTCPTHSKLIKEETRDASGLDTADIGYSRWIFSLLGVPQHNMCAVRAHTRLFLQTVHYIRTRGPSYYNSISSLRKWVYVMLTGLKRTSCNQQPQPPPAHVCSSTSV